MCGIAGFAHAGERGDLQAMMDALIHRGPDAQGFYQDPDYPVALGHRRLAVLDISGGVQPMWSEDGSVCVVFNGEIYNHGDLRIELEALGHRFLTSHSDTEVLVHGFKQWGTDLALRLNGMFALAIYDRRLRRFFLARDRFGEKPLYYIQRPGLFAFASELSALLEHSAVAARIDSTSVQKYFAYGYIPAPRSLYQGISKLPGGSFLEYRIPEQQCSVTPYWRFLIEPDAAFAACPVDDLAEEFWSHFSRAVSRRLLSDVPLGVFLSGGLDSSAVLAAAAEHIDSGQISTFTIGFRERSFDESHYARIVADHFGTRHHHEVLDLARARPILDGLLARMDEPIADGSIVPTFLLCEFARRHVTVALSGDGGDELLAGYDPFLALRAARIYQHCISKPLHRLLQWSADKLPRSSRNMSLDFKLRRTLDGLTYPASIWNPVWLAPLGPDMIADLFHAPLPAEELYSEAISLWHENDDLNLVDRTLEFYTNFYLQSDILAKVDRAAMMNSLESRAVFLDNDLVTFCQRLPSSVKLRGGIRKFLLKRALRRRLPASIIERKKKGFGIPIVDWLRDLPVPGTGERIPGMKSDRATELWSAHKAGKQDHRLFLWSWLCLERALREPAPARP